LLRAILDGFSDMDELRASPDQIESAWAQAEKRLGKIRGLADVANLIGLSESGFRARHRQKYTDSAGKHLQTLRLDVADQLLVTTGYRIADIAAAVGYGHAESFTKAYVASRGRSPKAYRRWCKRFA
jgi:transcriptional regulator GlxA family with amidase domain